MPKAKLDFAPQVEFSRILTNPILDIAANFWDSERYEAFRVFYRSMRRIDDLVDHRKASKGKISPAEADLLAAMIRDWLEAVRRREQVDEYQTAFLEMLDRFAVPFWPWERLANAMEYDLRNEGFISLTVFLRYCEGAAISPAAIFMHLCGVVKDGDRYRAPAYDIRQASRHLALFSYLVHIVRDFEKDQKNGLNYFAYDILAQNNLTAEELQRIAKSGGVNVGFRSVATTYRRIADYYRVRARVMIDRVLPQLEPRYQLSLEIIYGLYNQIFARIDVERGSFTTEALNPSPEEVGRQIEHIISTFCPAKL
ncbi:MAG TPA: squalene/phytoene synthase family protein [Candidatus Acidoferrum sp.]|nr:squalene/phytoene synthase family protein [Candidatus Acidoferrum sp.]